MVPFYRTQRHKHHRSIQYTDSVETFAANAVMRVNKLPKLGRGKHNSFNIIVPGEAHWLIAGLKLSPKFAKALPRVSRSTLRI